MAFQLIIKSKASGREMLPCVIDGVDVEWTRQGAAGSMTFTVIKDGGLSFIEGDIASLYIDGKPIFRGVIVKKSRDRNHQIEVTCYDNLYYLARNQGRYSAKEKTTDQIIREIAEFCGISHKYQNKDYICNTGYKIHSRLVNSATSYLDIMQEMIDVTLADSGKMFVLYDDFGTLTLKNIEDMKFNENKEALLISEDCAENFSYESSIEESYSSVAVYQNFDGSVENGELPSSYSFRVLMSGDQNAEKALQVALNMAQGYETTKKAVLHYEGRIKKLEAEIKSLEEKLQQCDDENENLLEYGNEVEDIKRRYLVEGVCDDPMILLSIELLGGIYSWAANEHYKIRKSEEVVQEKIEDLTALIDGKSKGIKDAEESIKENNEHLKELENEFKKPYWKKYGIGIVKNEDVWVEAQHGDKKGVLDAFVITHPQAREQWGNLVYYDERDGKLTPEELRDRARHLMELHGQVKRKLSIEGVFCDPRIRAGSSVIVDLNLGDVAVKKWFLVESVTHHFKNDHSTMDLTVRSHGGFIA